MKLKIGQIEILEATVEEFELLFARYGGCATSPPQDAPPQADSGHAEKHTRHHNGHTADRVVLENLVNAGVSGVSTQDAGELLGSRGKAIRRGLMDWAVRVHLIHDLTIDPFEDSRTGSRRGVRIKASFMPLAKELLAKWK